LEDLEKPQTASNGQWTAKGRGKKSETDLSDCVVKPTHEKLRNVKREEKDPEGIPVGE
jgi:hypothetical protein